MKTRIGFHVFIVIAMLMTGCSALPGLRVLTGEDVPTGDAALVVESTDLVMADKSDTTDPSIIAAANRIEDASGDLDIVEIRQDLSTNVFNVYTLMRPPAATATQLDYANMIKRAVELTWQGTAQESQGSDVIRISILNPGVISTLDNGPSFYAFVQMNIEISRGEALAYLASRPHDINAFIDLIAQGKMTIDNPEAGAVGYFYEGAPNHPLFMLPSPTSLIEGGTSDTTTTTDTQ